MSCVSCTFFSSSFPQQKNLCSHIKGEIHVGVNSEEILVNVLFDFLRGVVQATLQGWFCLTQLPADELETVF